MEVQIKNITNMFIEFWEKSDNLDFTSKKKLWIDLYRNPNIEIFEHLESLLKIGNEKFNIDNEIKLCLDLYKNNIELIKQMNDCINKEIEITCVNCSRLFEINDIKLNFIVMVGLYFADGMTTGYNDLTMFYFLEKIPTKKYLNIILVHEITHLFQFSQLRVESYNPTLAEDIFSEGLACYASSILYPNLKLSDYLFGTDTWINECEEHFAKIKSDLISNIKSTNYDLLIKYFVENNYVKNSIPNRIGYVIGYKVIEHLYKNYSFSEMISWQQERITEEVKDTLFQIL